jgi:hypothetical protein
MLLESLIRVGRVPYDRPCTGANPVSSGSNSVPTSGLPLRPWLPLQTGGERCILPVGLQMTGLAQPSRCQKHPGGLFGRLGPIQVGELRGYPGNPSAGVELPHRRLAGASAAAPAQHRLLRLRHIAHRRPQGDALRRWDCRWAEPDGSQLLRTFGTHVRPGRYPSAAGGVPTSARRRRGQEPRLGCLATGAAVSRGRRSPRRGLGDQRPAGSR